MIWFDEGITMGICFGEVLGTMFVNVDGIIIGLDVGTDLASLDRYFGSYNDGKFQSLLIGNALEYTDDKMLGFDEGIKLGYIESKVNGTILINVYEISRGLDVGTHLGSLDGYFDGYYYGKLKG